MITERLINHIQEIYGIKVYFETVSKITDKIVYLIEKWKVRPLEEIYYFTFLDAIYFSVKEDKSIIKKVVL